MDGELEPRFVFVEMADDGAVLRLIGRDWSETRVPLDRGELAKLAVDAVRCTAAHIR